MGAAKRKAGSRGYQEETLMDAVSRVDALNSGMREPLLKLQQDAKALTGEDARFGVTEWSKVYRPDLLVTVFPTLTEDGAGEIQRYDVFFNLGMKPTVGLVQDIRKVTLNRRTHRAQGYRVLNTDGIKEFFQHVWEERRVDHKAAA